MNPSTWNAEQWREAALALVVGTLTLVFTYTIIYIFH